MKRIPTAAPILLVMADGLGGLPLEAGGPTELEAAQTPHLNRLAFAGSCGLLIPPRAGELPFTLQAYADLFRPAQHERIGGAVEDEALLPVWSQYGVRVLSTHPSLGTRIDALEADWWRYDVLVLAHTQIDRAASAGSFPGKVEMIERLDQVIPRLLALEPSVMIVTGGWSKPSAMRRPTWHPVPLVLAADSARPDAFDQFGETNCRSGGLGRVEVRDLLALARMHAG